MVGPPEVTEAASEVVVAETTSPAEGEVAMAPVVPVAEEASPSKGGDAEADAEAAPDAAGKARAVEEFKAAMMRAAAGLPKPVPKVRPVDQVVVLGRPPPVAVKPEVEALPGLSLCVRRLAKDSAVLKDLVDILPRLMDQWLAPCLGAKREDSKGAAAPERMTGRVKSYNTKKGFGFIDMPSYPRDIFVYNAHLIGRVGLVAGECVEFSIILDGDRPQARQVRVISMPNKAALPGNPLNAMKQAMAMPRPSPQQILRSSGPDALPNTVLPQRPGGSLGGLVKKTPEEQLFEKIREAQSLSATDKRQKQVQQTSSAAAVAERLNSLSGATGISAGEPEGSFMDEGAIPRNASIRVTNFPATEVNDCVGVVQGYDALTGRYNVIVEMRKEGNMPAETVPLQLREEYLRVENMPSDGKGGKPLGAGGGSLMSTAQISSPPATGPAMSSALQKSANEALKRFSQLAQPKQPYSGMPPAAFGPGGFPPSQQPPSSQQQQPPPSQQMNFMQQQQMGGKGPEPRFSQRTGPPGSGGMPDPFGRGGKGDQAAEPPGGNPFQQMSMLNRQFPPSSTSMQQQQQQQQGGSFAGMRPGAGPTQPKGAPKGGGLDGGQGCKGGGKRPGEEGPGGPGRQQPQQPPAAQRQTHSTGTPLEHFARPMAGGPGVGQMPHPPFANLGPGGAQLPPQPKAQFDGPGGPQSMGPGGFSQGGPQDQGQQKFGNTPSEGRTGQMWKVLQSKEFCDVIVRETQEVASQELRRIMPNEVCMQRGPTVVISTGLVRMPISPEGWVTVHARAIGGPTFLEEVDRQFMSQQQPRAKQQHMGRDAMPRARREGTSPVGGGHGDEPWLGLPGGPSGLTRLAPGASQRMPPGWQGSPPQPERTHSREYLLALREQMSKGNLLVQVGSRIRMLHVPTGGASTTTRHRRERREQPMDDEEPSTQRKAGLGLRKTSPAPLEGEGRRHPPEGGEGGVEEKIAVEEGGGGSNPPKKNANCPTQ